MGGERGWWIDWMDHEVQRKKPNPLPKDLAWWETKDWLPPYIKKRLREFYKSDLAIDALTKVKKLGGNPNLIVGVLVYCLWANHLPDIHPGYKLVVGKMPKSLWPDFYYIADCIEKRAVPYLDFMHPAKLINHRERTFEGIGSGLFVGQYGLPDKLRMLQKALDLCKRQKQIGRAHNDRLKVGIMTMALHLERATGKKRLSLIASILSEAKIKKTFTKSGVQQEIGLALKFWPKTRFRAVADGYEQTFGGIYRVTK